MITLNNKKKLIGAIAIILVAVILAIAITTNIVNRQIGNEGYLSTTANANSNLVAGYIKKGITIGGITGTLESLNTFDATAEPEDILWGKTGYVKGEKITGTRVNTVALGKESQKVFEENTILIDDYGNSVKIPEGFKIAEDSATTVTGGVVIEDISAGDNNTKGSQFVWVPIGDVITNENNSKITITLGRYTFDDTEKLVQNASEYANETQLKDRYNESEIGGYYQEFLKDTATNNSKAKDIEDFIKKATSSGGYYIGRYEAGDLTAIDNARTNESNDNNPLVCKAGVYPYTFVTQIQASQLCQNMYETTGFESDLVNSYAWDTALKFIQSFSTNKNYANKEIPQNDIIKCGEIFSGEEKDVECNIYDMAKTPGEYITESFVLSETYSIVRGSVFMNTYHRPIGRDPVLDISTSYNYISFRPILYL